MQQYLKDIIEHYFQKDEILDKQIFNELTLYVYSLESKDSDLYMLAKMLDEESLQKIIAYYDGDSLKLPTREEYKNCVLTALCMWLKTFKGYSWIEIKEYLEIPENNKDILSSISIGGKINKVQDNLGKELFDHLNRIEEKDFIEFYKKVQNDRYS